MIAIRLLSFEETMMRRNRSMCFQFLQFITIKRVIAKTPQSPSVSARGRTPRASVAMQRWIKIDVAFKSMLPVLSTTTRTGIAFIRIAARSPAWSSYGDDAPSPPYRSRFCQLFVLVRISLIFIPAIRIPRAMRAR